MPLGKLKQLFSKMNTTFSSQNIGQHTILALFLKLQNALLLMKHKE